MDIVIYYPNFDVNFTSYLKRSFIYSIRLKHHINRISSAQLYIAYGDILLLDEQTYDSAIMQYKEALKYDSNDDKDNAIF
jgi:hypothetical protein